MSVQFKDFVIGVIVMCVLLAFTSLLQTSDIASQERQMPDPRPDVSATSSL